MHLQDLDVELVVERCRHAPHQRRHQIDAEAHVRGADDDCAAGERLELRLVLGGKTRRAGHVNLSGLRAERREAQRGGRRGEIEDAVGLGKERLGIGD